MFFTESTVSKIITIGVRDRPITKKKGYKQDNNEGTITELNLLIN